MREIQDKIWTESHRVIDQVLEDSAGSSKQGMLMDETERYRKELFEPLVKIQEALGPTVHEVVAGPGIADFLKERVGDLSKIRPFDGLPLNQKRSAQTQDKTQFETKNQIDFE